MADYEFVIHEQDGPAVTIALNCPSALLAPTRS